MIRSVDTGATMATLPGQVVSFSDHDSRVFVNGPGLGGIQDLYEVVNWRTGAVVWSAPLIATDAVTRPGTGDFLLETWNYRPVPGTNTNQPYFVPLVVHADGTTARFPTEVSPA
jgi:hypothetical protein